MSKVKNYFHDEICDRASHLSQFPDPEAMQGYSEWLDQQEKQYEEKHGA